MNNAERYRVLMQSIEVNISKTLSRYNIFDNSCAKTIYTYSFGDNKDSTNNVNMEQQLDHYFDI